MNEKIVSYFFSETSHIDNILIIFLMFVIVTIVLIAVFNFRIRVGKAFIEIGRKSCKGCNLFEKSLYEDGKELSEYYNKKYNMDGLMYTRVFLSAEMMLNDIFIDEVRKYYYDTYKMDIDSTLDGVILERFKYSALIKIHNYVIDMTQANHFREHRDTNDKWIAFLRPHAEICYNKLNDVIIDRYFIYAKKTTLKEIKAIIKKNKRLFFDSFFGYFTMAIDEKEAFFKANLDTLTKFGLITEGY